MRAISAALLFILITFTFSHASGTDKDKEIAYLEKQIQQQKAQIEIQKKTAAEFSKILKLNDSLTKPAMQVLERLDDLDRQFYNGAFVQKAINSKASTEEIFSAYHLLLEKIESDLKGI